MLTAYSVITVFGAEVPPGRLLTVCIAGLARQSLLSVQLGSTPSLRTRLAGTLLDAVVSPGQLHVRQAGQPGRMVRTSVPGAIWLALIPYVASSCGVATYTVPVKF